MLIIDSTNIILGRLATYAAKKALLGETVRIINCNKAVITGDKIVTLKKFKERRDKGDAKFGPFYPKTSERIVKRAIRGMLPYKQPKGRMALERIKCFNNVPEDFQDKKVETIKGADIGKLSDLKYLYVGDIAKHIGAKQ